MLENYKYFRSLGYTSIMFMPGVPSLWTSESNSVLEQQLSALGDILIEEYRNNRCVSLNPIEQSIFGIINDQRPQYFCGAGRGLLLVDIHGDLWPCHRWNKSKERIWRIGNIYRHFNHIIRSELDTACQTDRLVNDCVHCIAKKACSGGCPAENLEETGNLFNRQANACEHQRAWVRVAQRVHDVLYKERNPLFIKRFYNREVTASSRVTA